MPSSRPKRSISSDRLAFRPSTGTSDWSSYSAAWAQLRHLSVKVWSCVKSFWGQKQGMCRVKSPLSVYLSKIHHITFMLGATQIIWKGIQYLAPVHFNHLESAQSLHLVFDVLPQLVSLLCKVLWRRMCWFGNGSRKPFTPWSCFISVYIDIGDDQRRVISGLPGICWNLLATLLLLLINTKAFGHREGRGEGAPWSLQPLLQRGTQLLMLQRWQWINDK